MSFAIALFLQQKIKLTEEVFVKRFITVIVLCAFALVLYGAPVVNAQTNDPNIEKRMENQEKRIQQGVQSGQLTPKETGRLEAEQAKIKQDEERMKSDGKLTQKERTKLNKELNKSSNDIYKKKHNQKKVNVN
jgi:septal ring factor EnvC (AmiA/AmiB activator)